MALQIQTQPPDSTTTLLSLEGNLDALTAPELDQFLSTKLDPAAQILVLDLAKLRFVSSAGLRIFAKAQKLMKSRQGKVLFVNLSPQVQRVFEIVKVASNMQIFTSEEELDAYLASIQDQIYEDDEAS
ncbi:MAG: anti-sigma factor antagonist SpoIIAA-2 [Chthonomonadales bacterium]|nr:anti-sigma factor antagonist SpoIIAA-2 [Chthonomonadales bacterium]